MLEGYRARFHELIDLVYRNRFRYRSVISLKGQITTRDLPPSLSTHTMHLDQLSTLDLDHYDRVLALSRRCVEGHAELNAHERIIFTKLAEILALEAEIMADHASELEESCHPLTNRFARARDQLKQVRSYQLEAYRVGYWRPWSGARLEW